LSPSSEAINHTQLVLKRCLGDGTSIADFVHYCEKSSEGGFEMESKDFEGRSG
jgi:hypothetical protein